MRNPILLVQNAGYGETPVPDDALMQPGDEIVLNDDNDGSKTSVQVIAVVEAGGCIDYAIADQNKQPRPLVVRDNWLNETMYVLNRGGEQVLVSQRTMRKGLKMANERGLNDDRTDDGGSSPVT